MKQADEVYQSIKLVTLYGLQVNTDQPTEAEETDPLPEAPALDTQVESLHNVTRQSQPPADVSPEGRDEESIPAVAAAGVTSHVHTRPVRDAMVSEEPVCEGAVVGGVTMVTVAMQTDDCTPEELAEMCMQQQLELYACSGLWEHSE